MSTMTLEPCPFCGKAGPFDQWPCEWLDATEANVVRCPHCHGAAPMATWNRRAHLAQPAQAVDVVELAAALMEHLPDNRAPTRHELIRALTLTRAEEWCRKFLDEQARAERAEALLRELLGSKWATAEYRDVVRRITSHFGGEQ